ncbi:short-chain dehydrogenase [Deinococcus sp. DB0503]|uniref:short-chain dehydrogenase n=1 Tax=Deinococcus sp. DB0503 TaxID=2479203 RepID=UPI0018DFF1D0|nr:short-chain dehydrogenase [Deinococcus sp. DB0503]MBI0445345.1 short-chain dehydrogenase [Deinococcus sp. DB0503]
MRTLVVGGTGMLAGVVRALLDAGDEVTVLARRPERLADPRAHLLALDYRDTAALEQALAQAGPVDRAVVWIHGTAPEAPAVVVRHVHGPYWHVLGSAVANPAKPHSRRREQFAALGNDYREIILGFVLEGDNSRWLTHAEISGGVLHALRHDLKRHVIGVVEPWARRPA